MRASDSSSYKSYEQYSSFQNENNPFDSWSLQQNLTLYYL